MFPWYRNKSIDLESKSIDWFLYEGSIGRFNLLTRFFMVWVCINIINLILRGGVVILILQFGFRSNFFFVLAIALKLSGCSSFFFFQISWKFLENLRRLSIFIFSLFSPSYRMFNANVYYPKKLTFESSKNSILLAHGNKSCHIFQQ